VIGLDLFSGIGGITVALEPWVRPIAYCENDRYCQAVLLSRMADGSIPVAPIWDDVRSLDGRQFRGMVDIIYGGFPCQNISCAGRQEGLGAKQSGLFFEIMRLAEEIKPAFIFLENVPAIRTKGLGHVIAELAALRYDCRWGIVSAFDVGAPHRRKRWFCLACHSNCNRKSALPVDAKMAVLSCSVSNIESKGCEITGRKERIGKKQPRPSDATWDETQPAILRMDDELPMRVDRVKGLGNAVVPAQAREAFRRLMGVGGGT
jgi:DNA (cytosine-5)-methyltransferase 1